MPSSLSGFIENMLETCNDKRRSNNDDVKNVSQNSNKIIHFYNVTKHGEIYHELLGVHHYINRYIEYLLLKKYQYKQSQLVRNIFKVRSRYSLYEY